ncbi:MAG: serine/threonine protein kinase, partial [Cyanothece sp. SIO1E1]|nr:serine/threonine protein kinase [Cyanothece sp. SIO1E1]
MTIDEVLAMVDSNLKPDQLSTVQELVLRHCWLGRTYQEIAEDFAYDADYVRGVGSRLWQKLSDAFGEKVTKSNIQSILRQQQRSHAAFRSTEEPKQEEWESFPHLELEAQDWLHLPMELPGEQVPLHSSFYVERLPIESICYETILQPGALIRIKAPKQMGKTSLMVRILAQARTAAFHTVTLNFHLAEIKA